MCCVLFPLTRLLNQPIHSQSSDPFPPSERHCTDTAPTLHRHRLRATAEQDVRAPGLSPPAVLYGRNQGAKAGAAWVSTSLARSNHLSNKSFIAQVIISHSLCSSLSTLPSHLYPPPRYRSRRCRAETRPSSAARGWGAPLPAVLCCVM